MARSFDHLDPLSHPALCQFLFYPRPDPGYPPPEGAQDHLFRVGQGVTVGARFYTVPRAKANILFFHGNGEIASDYDDLGPVYNHYGINFYAVDYRGYGKSTGQPTPRSLLEDAHPVFEEWIRWVWENGKQAPLILMGRSLGSAPALELADSYQEQVAGLIIESGMAYTVPLARALGFPVEAMGITEANGFQNADKISRFEKPTLIIHAEMDDLIPLKVGEILHAKCPAEAKRLYVVPGATHNDIFYRAGETYFRVISEFIDRYMSGETTS